MWDSRQARGTVPERTYLFTKRNKRLRATGPKCSSISLCRSSGPGALPTWRLWRAAANSHWEMGGINALRETITGGGREVPGGRRDTLAKWCKKACACPRSEANTEASTASIAFGAGGGAAFIDLISRQLAGSVAVDEDALVWKAYRRSESTTSRRCTAAVIAWWASAEASRWVVCSAD